MRNVSIIAALTAAMLLFLPACKDGGRADKLARRAFPEVKVPTMLGPEEAEDYVLTHFWDAYLDTTSRYYCDSSCIAGVDDRIVAAELVTYLKLLGNIPAQKAETLMGTFFDKLESYQRADTSSNAFSWICEAVEYYLYNPNSDIRCEELFLPFVSRLALSDLAPEGKRQRYAAARVVCSSNRLGTPAPDFIFMDENGRQHTLYGEKAPFTLLMFVNPGCEACEGVVHSFGAGSLAEALSNEGLLRIIDIYIDEDLDAWREKLGGHPGFWLHGYEPLGAVREDNLYYVRAIPSIYLLDSEKRIMLKDAVPEDVVNVLTSVAGGNGMNNKLQ